MSAASIMMLAFSCSSKEEEPATLPVVTTSEYTDLTESSFKAGGEVTEDGGADVTAKGIVFGEEPNPTIEVSSLTVDGNGIGVFESNATDLKASTTYYYRAYATNEVGTSYGDEKTLKTTLAETISFDIDDGVALDMVLVKPGTFKMGNPGTDDLFVYEKPVHNVTLTKSYYIGKYEVTQEQWIAVMGSNPSIYQGNKIPVHQVSYNMCLQFIAALNEKTGKTFSMPTEAQWEFAARGGNKSEGHTYSGSDNITEVGWCMDNIGEGMQPCGQLKPNELGIYDMSGNAQEWVSDYFYMSGYDSADQTDPVGPSEPSNQYQERCVRGGSWLCESIFCTVYKRVGTTHSDNMGYDYGFRLVLNNEE